MQAYAFSKYSLMAHNCHPILFFGETEPFKDALMESNLNVHTP